MIPRISGQKITANATMLGIDTKKVAQNTKNKLAQVKLFDLPAKKQTEKSDKFVKQLCDSGDWNCFPSWVC
ncbi:MAG: hypothetical protein KHX03_01670 [Clostridium sp.]|nr:hypothetical protein [Clostridium sp.]